MAPPASTAARRATATPQARPASRRPPLRVVGPEPRRSTRRRASRRSHVWLAVAVVVASLLLVVVGDALVAQNQIRLTDVQLQISAAQANQKSMQVDVADLAAPDRVVAQALADGLVTSKSVTELPYVPLDVPLPVPHTGAAGNSTVSPPTQ